MKFNMFLLIGTFFYIDVYPKKILVNSLKKSQNFIENNQTFKVLKIEQLLEKNKNLEYRKVVDTHYFNAPIFSIASKFPQEGCFEELFIVSIPQGKVYSKRGHVFVDNQMIEELIWDKRYDILCDEFSTKKIYSSKKVIGKVAVISQFGYNNYFHFLHEILGRLALLEMANIKYDWLYVADEMPYAQELLELWGIDTSKIISAQDGVCIEAEELIVPSLVSNTTAGHNHAGSFIHPVTMKYIREKLIKAVQEKNILKSDFSKKIFISRKDAYATRRILNEDEIYKLLEQKDFVRYELANMSVTEQIMLFLQAEIVVSEQGSGLTNILFCRPGVKIYEIFQAMVDNCFWWQSYVNNLVYLPVLTIPIDVDYFAGCKSNIFNYQKAWQSRITIPIEPLKEVFKQL